MGNVQQVAFTVSPIPYQELISYSETPCRRNAFRFLRYRRMQSDRQPVEYQAVSFDSHIAFSHSCCSFLRYTVLNKFDILISLDSALVLSGPYACAPRRARSSTMRQVLRVHRPYVKPRRLAPGAATTSLETYKTAFGSMYSLPSESSPPDSGQRGLRHRCVAHPHF